MQSYKLVTAFCVMLAMPLVGMAAGEQGQTATAATPVATAAVTPGHPELQNKAIVVPKTAKPKPASKKPVAPPVKTRDNVVWVDGDWYWNGDDWDWADGYWLVQPYEDAFWVPGHWVDHWYGWSWVPGYWYY